MIDIQDWLDQGKSYMDLASSGPWEVRDIQRYGEIGTEIHVSFDYGDLEIQGPRTIVDDDYIEEHNAQFIADARTRLPQAIKVIEAIFNLHSQEKPEKGSPAICSHCHTVYPCLEVKTIQNIISLDEEWKHN